MNRLHSYGGKFDCKDLKVTLKDEKGREVCFYVQREETPRFIISTMKASKLLCQSCIGYWCYAIETKAKEEKAEDIPVVCEFKDFLPKGLPGLAPQREIDFEIVLVLGAQPNSRDPYRMALTELRELKIWLEELLQKEFIRPSVSLWGAPVLCKEKR